MMSTSQSYPQAFAPRKRLTITEAPFAKARSPERELVGNRIYVYAALGTLLGILFGAGVAYLPRIHSWPGLKMDTVHAKTIAAGDVTHETKSLGPAAAHAQPEVAPQN